MVKYGAEYERALAALIVMMAPMAPHFASELWAKFAGAPNRVCQTSNDAIRWDGDVMEQSWPTIDPNYKLNLIFKVSIDKK